MTTITTRIISAAFVVFAASSLAEEGTVETDSVLWYGQPAESWMMEALPIGNGRMGAMLFR